MAFSPTNLAEFQEYAERIRRQALVSPYPMRAHLLKLAHKLEQFAGATERHDTTRGDREAE
jgi:hypothetical protein